MTPDKKPIKAIDLLLKDIGSYKPCKDWSPDCAQCKIYVMAAYLEWSRYPFVEPKKK